MPGSFSVEPTVVRTGGRSLEAAADELDAAVRRLRSAVADAGEPWGHDRPGRSFEGGYRGPAQGALTRLASLPRALELAGAGLAAMADLYEIGDDASAVGP